MPDWISTLGLGICSIFFIVAILASTPVWEMIFKKNSISTLASTSSQSKNGYRKVLIIEQPMPSNRFPLIGDILSISCSALILAIGVLLIRLWVLGRILPPNGWEWVLFFLLVPFPILGLVDTLIIERRQYKKGESRVAKHRIIVMRGHIDAVFNKSLKAFNLMNAPVMIMERPKLIKSRHGNAILNVTLEEQENNNVIIHIASDSKWMTTKIDFGINQRNVNVFERLMRG